MKHTAINLTVLFLAMVLLLAPAGAQGQTTSDERAPRPDELAVVENAEMGADGFLVPDEMVGAPWSGMMWGLVAMAVVLCPVFVNARRSHFD